MATAVAASCIFCQTARSATSTKLLYSDEKVVAFQYINPSAFSSELYNSGIIPVEHVPTVKNLGRRTIDYELVNHMCTKMRINGNTDLVFTNLHSVVLSIFTCIVWRIRTHQAGGT